MDTQTRPVWFITGCSTGFGRELAKQVLGLGWRTIVTARDPAKIQDLTAGHEGHALALRLDVTDPARVREAVAKAEETFGGIDVLVNNAGYGYLGAIEESEEHEIRAMFETNFFGLDRMIHAVLPSMRRRRRGHIVNISSIAGFASLHGGGYYSATKFAVEALSEALALELAPLGIKVVIVEPGPFRTDFAGRSLKASPIVIDDYDSTAGATRRRIESIDGVQAGDPARAARAIIEVVQTENPPLRLLLGSQAYERAQVKLESLRNDFDTWKPITFGTDFPENER